MSYIIICTLSCLLPKFLSIQFTLQFSICQNVSVFKKLNNKQTPCILLPCRINFETSQSCCSNLPFKNKFNNKQLALFLREQFSLLRNWILLTSYKVLFFFLIKITSVFLSCTKCLEVSAVQKSGIRLL